ncbi:GspE/PulE family protein [Aliikangiella coralliicola]|uniref:Type II/IV secretion system protein n=1 Tax=Aliikangiella coralliicola TaxID=2592383 RepID=A0A545UAH3_9GAMM|nr:GspE/PulE family protein [Aliikangiella coralliicola]TQV86465.1 type II/IV secretion system protein [Aliikangiella coralliicola]
MQTTISRKTDLVSFLSLLEKKGVLNTEQAKKALAKLRAKKHSGHPVNQVASLKLKSNANRNKVLTAEFLTEWFAAQNKMPYVRLDPLKINVDAVTSVMSKAFAIRHNILACEVSDKEVTIAVIDPLESSWEAGLTHILRKPIKRVFANPETIARLQNEFYNLSRSMKGASGESLQNTKISNLEQLLEVGKVGDIDANDQHVVQIVDWLLQYAFSERASDIHIEPRRETANIRLRIDGVLHKVYEMPANISAAVTARFKILGRMDVAERRKPLDGRIKTKTPNGLEIELRLSTLPTAFGEKLVARIFDPTVLLRDFNELGLDNNTEKHWLQMAKQPTGIVLLTGPTGSGKTTTLYTTLKLIASPEVNVCTIEDPIEMVEPAFNQMQVHHDIDVDFASGVRALLRQDPDIIMIGEIRDKETAEMAIQASLTGHLVISTLHTNDASSAITRLQDIGVPPYLINATLLGVMAQRLVRTLCPHCKQAIEPDKTAWEELTVGFDLPLPKLMFLPNGCDECRHSGYTGRVGIYELLEVDSNIRTLVTQECEVAPLRKQALENGMSLLRVSGARKVAEGKTTIAEVMRVASPAMEEL